MINSIQFEGAVTWMTCQRAGRPLNHQSSSWIGEVNNLWHLDLLAKEEIQDRSNGCSRKHMHITIKLTSMEGTIGWKMEEREWPTGHLTCERSCL